MRPMMHPGISYLPARGADETLYSLTTRYHRACGRTLASSTARLLFGARHAGLHHDFPSRLDEFTRRTDGVYGTPLMLVQQATILPYFTPFVRPETSAAAIRLMRGGTGTARLKFLLGLPASRVSGRFPLRACAACMQRDEDSVGEAYWHRDHQLPGVYVCATHEERLLETSFRIDLPGRGEYVLPRDIFGLRTGSMLSDWQRNVRTRLEGMLAQIAKGALEESGALVDPWLLHIVYIHGLRDLGLVTPGGRVRRAQFRMEFDRFVMPIQLRPQIAKLLGSTGAEGLTALLRKPQTLKHPLKHLLLIAFIFGSWERFRCVSEWEELLTVTNPFSEEPTSP
jgi:hypothetical protein